MKIASYSFKNIYICTPSQRFYLGSLDASFGYVLFSSSKFDSVEFGFTSSLPDDKVLYRVLVLALWLDGRPKEQVEGARKRDKQDTNHHHMFPRPSYRHHHFCLYQTPPPPPGLSPGESGPQQCVSQLQPHYFKNRAKGHYASDSSGLPIIFYLFFSTL